ncbi:MAG: PIN domain nuclease [Methylococcales bacterium]
MILVDTSVWIDFFNGKDLPHVATLEFSIQQEVDIAICGVVLTEVLQGISNDKQYLLTQDYLQSLLMLEIKDAIWLQAADIYRQLRKRGLTVRKTNDCIIAATALHYDCLLLHNDKDFATIALHYPLRTC